MKTYIKPEFDAVELENENLLGGSVWASAPDMEYSCGCECLNCKTGNHHPQEYSVSGGYCDYLDDLNDPF